MSIGVHVSFVMMKLVRSIQGQLLAPVPTLREKMLAHQATHISPRSSLCNSRWYASQPQWLSPLVCSISTTSSRSCSVIGETDTAESVFNTDAVTDIALLVRDLKDEHRLPAATRPTRLGR